MGKDCPPQHIDLENSQGIPDSEDSCSKGQELAGDTFPIFAFSIQTPSFLVSFILGHGQRSLQVPLYGGRERKKNTEDTVCHLIHYPVFFYS